MVYTGTAFNFRAQHYSFFDPCHVTPPLTLTCRPVSCALIGTKRKLAIKTNGPAHTAIRIRDC